MITVVGELNIQLFGDGFDAFDSLSRPFRSSFFCIMRDRTTQCDNAVMRCDIHIGGIQGRFPSKFLQHVLLQLFVCFHDQTDLANGEKKSRRAERRIGIQSRLLTLQQAPRISGVPFTLSSNEV